MATKNQKCILCGRTVKSRGLCALDYATASAAVKSKKTTWEKLEREKKSAPSLKPSRKEKIEWFVKGKVAASAKSTPRKNGQRIFY